MPAGYSLRPRYGGDGFYIDRPKPKSKTSDTPGVRRSGKRPRHIFSTFGFDSDGDSHSSMSI